MKYNVKLFTVNGFEETRECSFYTLGEVFLKLESEEGLHTYINLLNIVQIEIQKVNEEIEYIGR